MTPATRRRLIERAVAGRYDLFVGLGAGLAILGVILFAQAVFGGEPDRAWQLFHVNWLFFTGLAAGSVALAAVHKITNAKWSGMILRFAEASSAFLPVSLLGLVFIFTAGYEHIFGLMHEALHELPHSKAVWLSHGFMFGRLAVGLTVLTFLGWALVKADLIPDLLDTRGAVPEGRRRLFDRWLAGYDGSPAMAAAHEDRIRRLAPIYAVAYVVVMTLIAFDAIMALQPHWFSNLFGGFFFMGAFLGAHTLLAILMLYGGRHLGVADLISPKQRHDLGKLIFGFTVFWAYLMWAQFLVIWYGNLPEETGFVFARLWGHWLPVGRWVFMGMFVVPFIGLLGVAPKKFPVTLGVFASVSLVTLWSERYLLVLPSVTPLPGPVIGIPEIGPTVLFVGLFMLCYAIFARTFPMISPRLAMITLDRERGHAHVAAEFDHEEAPEDYVPAELVERRERPR